MQPVSICLHKHSKILEISFIDSSSFSFSCEFLRVYSPSAEVRGHSADQAKLQVDKQQVGIEKIDAVGNYAVKLYFDDGHQTGIYSWSYLYELGQNQEKLWLDYLEALKSAGYERT